ncbi:MAG: M36 family metallopeptidase [Verrucomicrobiota bacterium]
MRVFRPPLDLSTVPPPDPRLYWDASVVNLFYWCNWMHDRLYELGFTRAAGNLEGPDNFLLAQAQFGADATQMISDAARLQYAPEGQHCRLFTSLWSGPNPDRDSAFDTEIILHEYAHALTFRSIGGGAGPRDARSQYMGMCEGWSDFYALALLAESTDDLNGHYPFAAYSTYQWYGEDFENYYFGLRAYPYARDMKHDPRTFRDIDRVKAVGHPGIPIHPIWEPFPPGELAQQAHHKGGVWCSVLWDARANLIDKLGFSWGNGRMLQLVTDGVMALSMSSPTFLQARDAILDADAGVNGKELWAAFYKRGLGGGAKDLSTSEATASVLESFNRADFDLDGRPDLLLQNAAGLVKVWHMDGRTNQSESVIGQLGGSWRVVATADINHDGRADLFLQDNSSSVGYRLLDGTNIIGSGTVMPSLPDPTTWQVVGTGDFDQDSNPDLLWQDPRGGLAVWYMDGTKQRTTSRLDPIGTFDPNWRVVATGDFNQDGQIDILFQHSSTMLAVWYMNGIHRLQSVLLQPAYSRGAWRAFAVEDYNGDGYPDILFQEKGTLDGGNLAIWFLKGLQEAGARLLVPSPNPGVDFNLVGPR